MVRKILEDHDLSTLTTLKLGGKAKYYYAVQNDQEILECYRFAAEKNIPVHILGGGSNTIFSDQGYPGLVMHLQTAGVDTEARTDNHVVVRVKAGHIWDSFVRQTIQYGLAGVECLSGIPGTTGAAPIQNIGAYGQEVKDTVIAAEVLAVSDLHNGEYKPLTLSSEELQFSYRSSRFKSEDKGKFVIISVLFQLSKSEVQQPVYSELVTALGPVYEELSHTDRLIKIRETVLQLRKKKSMVIDENDPDSRSAGSFFLNPVLSSAEAEKLNSVTKGRAPLYETSEGMKTSAAFLIEFAGFKKGQQLADGICISNSHALALVNRGGTAAGLLEAAQKIAKQVQKSSGVKLQREPVYAE